MNPDSQEFNRGAIRPFACLREAWLLIKDDYWLFLGITLVGLLLGSMAGLILSGPMMCGIHLCLLRREREQSVSFNNLFQGFDYFVPSLIATLIMLAPTIVLLLGSYLMAGIGVIAMFVALGKGNQGPPDESMIWGALSLGGIVLLGGFLISILLKALFLFTYPLIVDRHLTGIAAVQLSVKAARANLGGVVGLIVLNEFLGLAGVMACYFGVIFVLPLNFALMAIAYRHVFPADDLRLLLPSEAEYDEPDEAIPTAIAEDTGIQT
jgi:uncharacterized membrane protein